jgi:hypothetical protein
MASVNGNDQFSFDFLPGSFQVSDLYTLPATPIIGAEPF